MNEILNKIINGDCRNILKDLPCDSVDLVITSPPYYKQRDYGGEGIGNEKSVEEYIFNLTAIFRECVRIIKKTGSIVFNLGDKYEERSLLLVPYRFALEACKIPDVKLINQITWVKVNPTPKQDKKKLVSSTEPFFVFVKSEGYFFDKSAFLDYQDSLFGSKKTPKNGKNVGKKYFELIEKSQLSPEQKKQAQLELEKVIIEVQKGEIESFRMKIKGLHSMPYGGQEGGRKIHIERDGFTIIRIHGNSMKRDLIESPVETIKGNPHPAVYPEFIIQEFLKLLTKEGDMVLDPFSGSGTTGTVAKRMNRKFIGIEINPEYCEYAKSRIEKVNKEDALEIIFNG